MAHVADKRILEACPACGSHRIACVMHTDLDFCIKCQRVWERLSADEPYTVDDEQMAFSVPCDNCAFRGKSPEREDSERWRDLQWSLEHGGQFFCHKGVPFTAVGPDGKSVEVAERNFEFPKRVARLDLAGRCQPYQAYDTNRMRLCRGFLNAHVLPQMKEFADEKQESP